MSRDSDPALGAFAITPNDSTDNMGGKPVRAIWVGGAGNIALTTSNGEDVTISGIIAGTLLPIRPSRIKSTSTTATNLVGFY